MWFIHVGAREGNVYATVKTRVNTLTFSPDIFMFLIIKLGAHTALRRPFLLLSLVKPRVNNLRKM